MMEDEKASVMGYSPILARPVDPEAFIAVFISSVAVLITAQKV
jgi:hypothetical protein